MPTIYRPGTRKGNRTFIVRGSIDGRQREIATDATNARDAARAWDRFAAAIRQRRQTARTFAALADAWMLARQASANDQRYVERLKAAWLASTGDTFGALPVAAVRPMHIDEAARTLYPHGAAATKNRQVYAPAAAILHYAAENGLRDYIVVRKLREPEPAARRPLPGTAKLLLGNTEGVERALLTVLFYQGWRISETLGLEWQRVDLRGRTLSLYVAKARRQKSVAMHPAVRRALAPLVRPDGFVFPWRTRSGVYKWLRPLCARLGIVFTPHMARHDFGSALEEAGATARDLVDVGSWTSEKSTARYRHAGDAHKRRILERRKL
jgi:integrase